MKMGLKVAVLAACLALAPAAYARAADATPEELAALFQEKIVETRLEMTLADGRLGGPGADLLRSMAAEARFFMIGEEHGSAAMGDFATALVADLAPLGYAHAAIEVDPWMAAKLEALQRDPNSDALRDYLVYDERMLSLPMYSWEPDARFTGAVIAANGDAPPALWGLDQVFIGAASVLFADIAAGTVNAEARALAADLAARAKGDLRFLGIVGEPTLAKLASLLSDPADADLKLLADAMIASARIYEPFMENGTGSAYAANLAREHLMKMTFLAHYRETTARDGEPPRVILKFGAYHLYRGLSPTHVPSLGNFVADFAAAEGAIAHNVVVVCGPGSKVADLMGAEQDCTGYFHENFPFLEAHVPPRGFVVFDLRPWKERPRRWASLNEDTRSLIWAYDAMVVVSGGAAASFPAAP